MKYTIEAIETMGQKSNWSDIGVCPAFGLAYLHARRGQNELPDFDDVIWEDNVEDIVENCRRFGVKEFTISSPFSGLIRILARFEELGVRVKGMVTINFWIPEFDGSFSSVPALKMEVV